MKALRRIAGTVVAAVVLSGLTAGQASAELRVQDFSGFSSGPTAAQAITNARTLADMNAFVAGYPAYSCVQLYAWANPVGNVFTAQVGIECRYNFPDPPPPPAGPTGRVLGVYSNKCVDVAGANPANGTAVQIYDCNGTTAQSWLMGVDGTVRALGKCMTVAGGGTANHTLIQLSTCLSGSTAQQWQRYGTGAKSLRNPYSGRCLDDLGFATANGSPVGLWDCNGLSNQQWVMPV